MILHNSIRVAQNLSRRNSHAQIKLGDMPSLNNRVRLTYGHRNPLNNFNYRETRELASNKHEQYSGSPEHQHCLGSEVPTNNVESCNGSAFLLYEGNQQRTVLYRNPDLAYERVVPQSHEVNRVVTHSYQVNRVAKRYAESKTSLRGAVHSITGSNPVQLSDSDLAFLRCLRLISPFAAVIRNPAVLSPSSFSFSISSKSSRGSLTESCKERLFFLPVAITETSYIRWCSVYTGKLRIKHLKWCSLGYTLVVFTLSTAKAQVRHKMAKPRGASTPSGLLTTNVSVDNEAAMKDHTTHPQGRNNYIWRFLALSAIGRNVIHITAATEREAREQSPAGCVMVFAGRLPVEDSHA
ncbi:hypothetical protein EKINANG_22200 [Enterobacter sp. KINAN-G]|nr:hypothetical protein EKINANG_22200 [Enterobacter sp. KINAN-G]